MLGHAQKHGFLQANWITTWCFESRYRTFQMPNQFRISKKHNPILMPGIPLRCIVSQFKFEITKSKSLIQHVSQKNAFSLATVRVYNSET